jgi:uncharacterized protein YqgC (DUF456 family)
LTTGADTTVFVLTLIGMLIGLFGLIIPVLPGAVIMWLAALGYGLLSGWKPLGIAIFAIITLLALFASIADNLLMGAGARQSGASWTSIILAFIAGIAGTLLAPPVGGLIAAPVVLLLLEYRRLGEWNLAVKSILGLAAGWGVSYIVRLGSGFLILLLWGIWAWKG